MVIVLLASDSKLLVDEVPKGMTLEIQVHVCTCLLGTLSFNIALLFRNSQMIWFRFLEAGADIIETATYQASVEGFKRHGNLSQETALSLIAKGVELAREVRDKFWSDHPELHTGMYELYFL